MTTPAAGWYPDPAGSGGTRWWNGSTWGEQVQPVAQPVPQPAAQPWGAASPPQQQWGAAAPQQQWGAAPQWAAQQQAAPEGFVKKNAMSIATLVVAALLVVLLAVAHVVVVAVLPILLAVSAVQRKEPLAWLAAGITAAVLIFAAINYF
jgi:hypothetical protein